ncbi:peptide deformylase [Frankia sp. CNm7]|uniref:Peptide deformylase n=1 Tax=Frankia nepalensis TaxID=1836974 RepID=A0A937UQL5_9ACTN|nr:peptide deformylase [Frankia nepalensis]MBL7501475.1 peptide deformylase [Frankia nepalensis]MBL7515830.1 peptide deformylase [Frankia nepalensis]MBL7519241.1 peptide deformylase [Frankia nepalensis]MBL7630362.1 peptide deformylase [Frankia nepalensis]
MSVREIRLFGDPVLRTKAGEVTTFDKELRKLVRDLGDTMWEASGAGLAAPQLGVSLRVFTYLNDDDEIDHLVNPVLGPFSEEMQDGEEGCLSLPGLAFELRRPERVLAVGQNMYGDPVTVEGSGIVSRCLQHETDHLDGVLFIDKLDRETKKAAMKAIREAEWANEAKPVIKTSPHPLFGGHAT